MINDRVLAMAAAVSLGAWGCTDSTGPDYQAGVQIQAGNNFTCALLKNGRVHCWGANSAGQLGDGGNDDRNFPRMIASGELKFRAIGIHGDGTHACGVTTSADAYCWGRNRDGQLGDGTTTDRSGPVKVVGDIHFQAVSAGARFTCGVALSGAAFCWGRGAWGNLGNGAMDQSTTPVAVSGNHVFLQVRAGSSSLACGITTSGDAYCWGLNWRGEVGGQTAEMCAVNPWFLSCASTPVRVPAPEGLRWESISPGSSYACGVLEDGRAVCWGRNESFRLGRETSEICLGGPGLSDAPCSRAPVEVSGGHRFTMIAAGSNHACGVTQSREAVCWGSNSQSQLGDGSVFREPRLPIRVVGGLTFKTITSGQVHTCGIATDNVLYCWGTNFQGQLGNPSALIEEIPVRVAPTN